MLDRLKQLRRSVPDDDIGSRTLVVHGNEFGFDPFGMSRTHIGSVMTVARFIYRHYFRAQAFGIERDKTGAWATISRSLRIVAVPCRTL